MCIRDSALGVSLVTKASLGTSPISSIPYVLSLNFPFTLGNFTIVFSILLIVLQILIDVYKRQVQGQYEEVLLRIANSGYSALEQKLGNVNEMLEHLQLSRAKWQRTRCV